MSPARRRIVVPAWKPVPLRYAVAYWAFFVIALPVSICLGAF